MWLSNTRRSNTMGELTLWMANAVSAVRIVGLGVIGIGILVVGIRFIASSMFGSERENVVAKSGIIALVVGAVIVIASSSVLALLYSVAGVPQH
jgi:hypothetical protein